MWLCWSGEKIVSADVNLSVLERERIDYPFECRTREIEIQCPIIVQPGDQASVEAIESAKVADSIVFPSGATCNALTCRSKLSPV